MKADIETREDIEALLVEFYRNVREDEVIGCIFNDIAKVNWEVHLPLIADFWEGVLFNRNVYKGNPLQVHLHLNEKVKLEKKHFDRWLSLFNSITSQMFEGPNTILIRQRAESIATVMMIKLKAASSQTNIL